MQLHLQEESTKASLPFLEATRFLELAPRPGGLVGGSHHPTHQKVVG